MPLKELKLADSEGVLSYAKTQNYLISKFAKQKVCLEIVKYLFLFMQWGGANSFIKNFNSLLSVCSDSLVLRNGKEGHVCVGKTCIEKDEFLATVLVDREYQEINVTSDYVSVLVICFGMHVQGINVKLDVCAFDMKVFLIVSIYSKFCSWGLAFELCNKREGLILITYNYVIINFNLKVQAFGVSNSLVNRFT